MANDKRQDQPGPRPGSQQPGSQQPGSQQPGSQHISESHRPESQHIADEPATDADASGATVQKPVTETGLPVEEQVRKEWDTNRDGGLPTPLRDAAR